MRNTTSFSHCAVFERGTRGHWVGLVVLAGLLAVTAGCYNINVKVEGENKPGHEEEEAAGETVSIPLGHWEGRGTFAFEAWSEGVEAYDPDGETEGTSRSYPTTFDARMETRHGREVTRVEILSRRGPIMDEEGDRTHLLMYIAPVKTLSAGAVLLELTEVAATTKAEELEPTDDAPPLPVHATLVRHGDTITLSVRYADGFTDHWCFSRGELHKVGMYSPGGDDENTGLITWTERLHRHRH